MPLPAGEWFRWRALPPMEGGTGPGSTRWSGWSGHRRSSFDTPPGQPLVLVRAGTVLPLDDGWAADGPPDDGRLAPGHGPRRPAVHCFASAGEVAAGGSYDDAGDGHGPGRVDRFNLAAGPSGPVLRWGRDGAYPAPGRLRVVVHGLSATRAMADGFEVEATVWRDDRGQATTSVDCRTFDELRFEF